MQTAVSIRRSPSVHPRRCTVVSGTIARQNSARDALAVARAFLRANPRSSMNERTATIVPIRKIIPSQLAAMQNFTIPSGKRRHYRGDIIVNETRKLSGRRFASLKGSCVVFTRRCVFIGFFSRRRSFFPDCPDHHQGSAKLTNPCRFGSDQASSFAFRAGASSLSSSSVIPQRASFPPGQHPPIPSHPSQEL